MEQITKIPLGPWKPQDELIWHYSKNGMFEVKSAYHLVIELEELEANDGASPSTKSKDHIFWNKSSKLQIPPKVRMFLWKACNGILATGQKLNNRIGWQVMECRICGCEVETDKHIFFECTVAKDTWRELN